MLHGAFSGLFIKRKNISNMLHILLNSGGFARKSLSTTSKSNMLAEGGVSTLATASYTARCAWLLTNGAIIEKKALHKIVAHQTAHGHILAADDQRHSTLCYIYSWQSWV
ncbi:hypothetical protein SDC9_29662 [bioreactor metagenome]|uniref:Uncharacterized protein n=1 Tax=bioreactor metagenome TaxID=1076179 RepID=A0A644UXP2_9ZZZZ|nr:hypothetical protein [Desulfovibrio desulfuricans]